MGGVDAIIAALRFRRVFAVASISAPYRIHDYPEKLSWMASKADFRRWLKNGFVELKDGESLLRLNYTFKEDQWTYDVAKLLPKVKQPALIIHGNRDLVVPAQDARAYASGLPRAKLKLIKGGDHRLRKHTPQVQRALGTFFKKFA